MSIVIHGKVTGDNHHFGDEYEISVSGRQQNSLVQDIYDAVVTLQTRKHQKRTEDQKNDYISDLIEHTGYNIAPQNRQGRSGSNKKTNYRSGEVDIAIKRNDRSGTIRSIVEAFELKCCNSTTIKNHIYKLIECYDTAGNHENFVIVYSKAQDFNNLWVKYQKFVEQEVFESKSQLKLLAEDEFTKAKVKIAQNELGENNCKLYHIFADFSL